MSHVLLILDQKSSLMLSNTSTQSSTVAEPPLLRKSRCVSTTMFPIGLRVFSFVLRVSPFYLHQFLFYVLNIFYHPQIFMRPWVLKLSFHTGDTILCPAHVTCPSSRLQGKIMCKCRLSGTPDLLLNFTNPRILDDVRCVVRSIWVGSM